MKEKIYSTLNEASPGLKMLKDDFFIIGASALILSDIQTTDTFDIDILTSKQDAKILEALWRNLRLADHKSENSELFRSTFSRYKFKALDIEIMGGLEVCKNNVWALLTIQEYYLLDIDGFNYKIPTLKEQIRIFTLFGRPKDLKKIEFITTHDAGKTKKSDILYEKYIDDSENNEK